VRTKFDIYVFIITLLLSTIGIIYILTTFDPGYEPNMILGS